MKPTLQVFRRRRLREWMTTFALLAVVARALLPVGFMPVAMAGGSRLVLCTAGWPAASLGVSRDTQDSSAGQNSYGADGSGRTHGQGTGDCTCPCAHGPSAAPLPAIQTFGAVAHATYATASADLSLIPSSAPARYRAPRGPPQTA